MVNYVLRVCRWHFYIDCVLINMFKSAISSEISKLVLENNNNNNLIETKY